MRTRADARHVTDLEDAETFSTAMSRAARRTTDGFAVLAAIGLTGGILANIFFLQDRSLHSAVSGATTVSVEPKAKAAPVAGPGTPAMIFAPAAPMTAAAPATAPRAAAAPAPAAPAPVAALPQQDALVPPAALPVPKTPSPVVADIQRELARRGFYDGAVDGLSGPKTEGAVRAFEQAARLRVTSGEPTDAVLAELRRAPAPQVAAAAPAAPRPAAPAPLAPAPVQTASARGMLPPAAVPGDAGVTGSVRPPGDVGGSNRILAVQRSLARLGYGPLKVDGQPGNETRLAILRFERDRNLPANGEITDRLVRELSAVSGMPVE